MSSIGKVNILTIFTYPIIITLQMSWRLLNSYKIRRVKIRILYKLLIFTDRMLERYISLYSIYNKIKWIRTYWYIPEYLPLYWDEDLECPLELLLLLEPKKDQINLKLLFLFFFLSFLSFLSLRSLCLSLRSFLSLMGFGFSFEI